MTVLNSCRQTAHDYLQQLLATSVETLSEQLFRLSEHSESNQEQTRLYEAMQSLGKNKAEVAEQFAAFLTQAFVEFQESDAASAQKHSQDDELMLVDKGVIEDDIAISVLVSKANNLYAETLWKLNKRLAVLRGGQQHADELNPFGPNVICEAMRSAVLKTGCDSKSKILMYKFLGQQFIAGLRELYSKLEKQLVEAKILPNLKFTGKPAEKKVEKPVPASESESKQTDVEQNKASGASQPSEHEIAHQQAQMRHQQLVAESVARQQELYEAIAHIQRQNTGPRAQTVAGVSYQGIGVDLKPNENTFLPVDYILALTAVQQEKALDIKLGKFDPLDIDGVEKGFFGELSKHKVQVNRQNMTSDDANAVDVVGMIFRYLLDDEKLPDSIKATLSHLHTPYLKLALMSEEFLNNHDHSARLLLNTMADAGARWCDGDVDNTVTKKIKAVVSAIVNGFVDDNNLFNDLLEDFNAVIEQVEKKAALIEARNLAAEKGLEKLHKAKVEALDAVQKKLENTNLSDAIRYLLESPWVDFLAFNSLRHGEDSDSMREGLAVVDEVIWSLSDDLKSVALPEYQSRLGKLATQLREGLQHIGYDFSATDELLDQLIREQVEALQNAGADSDVVSKAKESRAKKSANETESGADTAISRQIKKQIVEHKKKKVVSRIRAERKLTRQQQEIFDRLENVEFGTWFEFRNNKGMRQRLKLAWYSSVSGHYMFVNSDGIKKQVVERYALMQIMNNGKARILEKEDYFFLERAFKSIIGTFRLRAVS